MKIRTPPSGYIFLAGIPFCLSMLGIYITIFKSTTAWSGAAVMMSFAIGFIVWTRGFYLEINNTHLIYRDGMYKKKIISLNSITSIERGSVRFQNTGKMLGIPCIIVRHTEGAFDINTAMFKPGLLKLLNSEIAQIHSGSRKESKP
jgi:hypothetical protein